MINPTAAIIHYYHENETEKTETIPSSPRVDMTPTKSLGKSPTLGRRVLPAAPHFGMTKHIQKVEKSRSEEDIHSFEGKTLENHSENHVNKYKYNSLPRKKKESKSKQSVSSTFYVDGENLKLNLSSLLSRSPKTKKKEFYQSNTLLKKKISKSTDELSIVDKQTHVALYKFYPRHKDELAFVEGDPIQVLKIYDDLWYEGKNLCNGKQGLFPCRYVADILTQDMPISSLKDSDHMQFHMRFLGSVEVSDYKGDEILCFAIAKVVNQRSMLSTSNPPFCVLQVNTKGIRIVNIGNREKKFETDKKGRKTKHIDANHYDEDSNHFFSLKNVTFCGNHPKDRRYFGFITKHPDEHRFASHIFMSKYSTDPVARSIGECFQTFYETYMEYRAPTEDLYLE